MPRIALWVNPIRCPAGRSPEQAWTSLQTHRSARGFGYVCSRKAGTVFIRKVADHLHDAGCALAEVDDACLWNRSPAETVL